MLSKHLFVKLILLRNDNYPDSSQIEKIFIQKVRNSVRPKVLCKSRNWFSWVNFSSYIFLYNKLLFFTLIHLEILTLWKWNWMKRFPIARKKFETIEYDLIYFQFIWLQIVVKSWLYTLACTLFQFYIDDTHQPTLLESQVVKLISKIQRYIQWKCNVEDEI